jgi:hypothetical protein
VPADRQIDSLQQQQEMRRGGGKQLPKKKTQLPKTHFLISSLLIFQTLQEENKNRLSNWVATEIWFVDDPGGKKKVLKMMKERERERKRKRTRTSTTTTTTTTITSSSSLKTTSSTPTRGRKRVDGKLAKLGELK